ncbi:MAG: DUF4249 family protein [Crocinitomicaceae bacterium]|nr:DUF4249 family protein [Crocinitomicaceae bacterium]
MRNIIYLFVVTSVLISCQKVIDINLNESNPTPVFEGIYSAEDSTVNVKLSLTSNYFNSETSSSINNALVSITDNTGLTSIIPSIGDGMYKLQNYIPSFNTTYTLSVNYNDVVYSIQSDLTDPVPLDAITYEYTPGIFGPNSGYMVFLNFNDPIAIANYYQVVLSLNGEELNTLADMFILDDSLLDGNFVSTPLFREELFQVGDTIGMELRSIDKDVYHYFYELYSTLGGDSAAPANPSSNWDNNALGYFSAYGNSRKDIVIQ